MKTEQLLYRVIIIILQIIINFKSINGQELLDLNSFLDEETGWYEFENNNETVDCDNFISLYKEQFGLGVDDSLQVDSIFDESGQFIGNNLFPQIKQWYKNIEVQNAKILLSLNDEKHILRFKNECVQGLDIDVENPNDEFEALQTALEYIGAEEYAWENSEYNILNILEYNTNSENVLPQGKLILAQLGGSEFIPENYFFVWAFNIISTSPYGSRMVFVDAHTNAVIEDHNCQWHYMPNLYYPPASGKYEYQLNLSDEFNGPLNTDLWAFDYKMMSCNTPPMLSLAQQLNLNFITALDDNGQNANIMRITTKKENSPISYQCDNGLNYFDYSTAQIYSKDSYKNGYFEIRCRFPHTAYDLCSAFWMYGGLNQGNNDVDNYSEIDIFEHYGYDHNESNNDYYIANLRYASNLHCTTNDYRNLCLGDPLGHQYKPNVCIDPYKFHTYGIEWLPDVVTFFIDGTPLYDPAGLNFIHTVFNSCDGNGNSIPQTSIEDLVSMWIVIGQSINDNTTFIPSSANTFCNFDVDYFHYYKRKPVINLDECHNNTLDLSATMYGGNATTDTYSWTTSSNGSVVSQSGNTCSIQLNSGNSIDVTCTATESITGYVDNTNSASGYLQEFSDPRSSSITKTFNFGSLGTPPLPNIFQAQISSSCDKMIVAVEASLGVKYYFSDDGGNTWNLGTRKVYHDNVTHYSYYAWVYGVYDNGTYTIKVKGQNCSGDSPIKTQTFSYGTRPPHCLARFSSPQVINFDSPLNEINIAPNPGNQFVKIRSYLNDKSEVSLNLINLLGENILTVLNHDIQEEGERIVEIDASNLSNGIYNCELNIGAERYFKKLVITR